MVCDWQLFAFVSFSGRSYFNESDLQVARGRLGHLYQESRLVGVVFHDVVIHVDEDPEEKNVTLSGIELRCCSRASQLA